MRYRVNRVDTGSHALIEQAEALGAQYLSIGGVIDGILFFKGITLLVDWKGPKTPLTKKQQELKELGWPIHFIRNTDELIELLRSDRS
jgi:hypothetical protein